jgi:hypothetical protein
MGGCVPSDLAPTPAQERAEQALTRQSARKPWYRKADGIPAIVEGYSGDVVLYRRRIGDELLRLKRSTFEQNYNSPAEEAEHGR